MEIHYADRFEELKKIDFLIAKINVYHVYLKDYENQKEISDLKKLEIKKVLIRTTRLIEELITLVEHVNDIACSVVWVSSEE